MEHPKARLVFAAALALVVMLSSPAVAATITYSFSGLSYDNSPTGGLSPQHQSFTFDVPALITTSLYLTPAEMEACDPGDSPSLASCDYASLHVGSAMNMGVWYDQLLFRANTTDDSGSMFYYYFPEGTVSRLGVHATVPAFSDGGSGTLTVAVNEAPVPEPASLLLLSTGLLGLATAVRRRRG